MWTSEQSDTNEETHARQSDEQNAINAQRFWLSKNLSYYLLNSESIIKINLGLCNECEIKIFDTYKNFQNFIKSKEYVNSTIIRTAIEYIEENYEINFYIKISSDLII